MNYIYDIVLNFNSNYYEFYEWNKNDNIINVRKIPVFKVDNQTYYDFKFNDIIVNNDFLKLIENETSIYLGNTNKYMCIITNSKEAIGVMFNKKGLIIKKSSLIIDEENEVLELAYDILNIKIDYQINRVCKKIRFVSRSEGEKKKKIISSLNHLLKINNYELIKHIEDQKIETADIAKTTVEINKANQQMVNQQPTNINNGPTLSYQQAA